MIFGVLSWVGAGLKGDLVLASYPRPDVDLVIKRMLLPEVVEGSVMVSAPLYYRKRFVVYRVEDHFCGEQSVILCCAGSTNAVGHGAP
jgi:hypothetical protein